MRFYEFYQKIIEEENSKQYRVNPRRPADSKGDATRIEGPGSTPETPIPPPRLSQLSDEEIERLQRAELAARGIRLSDFRGGKKRKVSPMGFLYSLQKRVNAGENIKGQDAFVMMDTQGFGKTTFEKWYINRMGNQYIVLDKQPSANSVGGQLIVPHNTYANWQTAHAIQNKKADRPTYNKKTGLGGEDEPFDIPSMSSTPEEEKEFFRPKPRPGENWDLNTDD